MQSAIVAVLVLLFLLVAVAGFDKPGALMDEAMLLVYPEQILHGKMPYRDFESFYGPANVYLLAPIYRVFGVTLTVERCAGLLYRLAIVGAVFALTRRWSFGVACGCVFTCGMLLLNFGLAAFAWVGAAACALWAIFYFDNANTSSRTLIGGFFASAALLFRPDFAPAIALALAPFAVAMNTRGRIRSGMGFAIGMLPLLALMAVIGPRPIWQNLFAFPVLHSSAGRHISWAAAAPNVRWLFVGHLMACVINCSAGIKAVATRASRDCGRVLLAFALLAGGLTHQAMQRMDSLHVLLVAFLSFGMLPISLFFLLRSTVQRSEAPASILAVTAAIAFVAMSSRDSFSNLASDFVASLRRQPNEQFWVEENGRGFRFAMAPQARATQRLLDQLQRMALPGERLFVGPADLRRTNYNDTAIYYLMPHLQPATYFLEMNPGSANRRNSRLAQDIASADWLVLDRSLDAWNEANASRAFGSDAPNEIVRNDFEVKAEFAAYCLLRRKHDRS